MSGLDPRDMESLSLPAFAAQSQASSWPLAFPPACVASVRTRRNHQSIEGTACAHPRPHCVLHFIGAPIHIAILCPIVHVGTLISLYLCSQDEPILVD